MNDHPMTIDDFELNRLADGELSPAALRDLLIRLDQTSDGWKRAALALLEAQMLRFACRAAIIPPVTRPAVRAIALTTSRMRGVRELVAVAAAILATCGVGWWLMSAVPPTQTVSVPVAESVTPRLESRPPLDAVQMAFSGADGEWSDPVTAPVIDASDPSAQAWLTMRPTIPESVREKLAAQGQRVHERQTWVPVDLADGRVGVVPVTDLVVAPASLSDYQ